MAITTLGATSGQALAGVVAPSIEDPGLVGLVQASLALRRRSSARAGHHREGRTDRGER